MTLFGRMGNASGAWAGAGAAEASVLRQRACGRRAAAAVAA